MALYALENVDDALDVTREFLTSIGRWTWLKLAFVVLFIGGAGGGFPGFNVPGNGGGDAPPTDAAPPIDLGPEFWLFVAALVALVIAVVVVLGVVGATMEFVFVESLRSETVAIREYWGRYWRKGVRLFAFRFAVGLVTFGVFVLFGALLVVPFLTGIDVAFVLLLIALVVLIPLGILLAIVGGLVAGFTTMFVVPIMMLEDCGVIDGWRRLWPTVRAEWKQYLAYAVGAWILSLAGGIVVFLLAALMLVVVAVPFGIVFAVGAGLLAVVEPLGIAWLVGFGILFAIAVVAVFALAQVPVQTYLRYYALLVLGDVEDAFDVVPEQRAAVRADDEPDESDVAA